MNAQFLLIALEQSKQGFEQVNSPFEFTLMTIILTFFPSR